MPIVIQREALEEITAMSDYYQRTDSRLRIEFTEELELAPDRVRVSPRAWPEVATGIRKHLLHRFPYGLIYALHQDHILILAVMHLRRKPGYWKYRADSHD